MPEPSFDGRRRYGVLAAGAVGGLTLILAVVTPALATGPGDAERDRRGPSRNVLLLHAYPRLSPPVVGVDEAFRATLEAESPFPVYFYTEYLDLTLFDGDAPQRELRALLGNPMGQLYSVLYCHYESESTCWQWVCFLV